MTGPFQNTGSHQRECVHSAELTPMTPSQFQSNAEKPWEAISVGIFHRRLVSVLHWNQKSSSTRTLDQCSRFLPSPTKCCTDKIPPLFKLGASDLVANC